MLTHARSMFFGNRTQQLTVVAIKHSNTDHTIHNHPQTHTQKHKARVLEGVYGFLLCSSSLNGFNMIGVIALFLARADVDGDRDADRRKPCIRARSNRFVPKIYTIDTYLCMYCTYIYCWTSLMTQYTQNSQTCLGREKSARSAAGSGIVDSGNSVRRLWFGVCAFKKYAQRCVVRTKPWAHKTRFRDKMLARARANCLRALYIGILRVFVFLGTIRTWFCVRSRTWTGGIHNVTTKFQQNADNRIVSGLQTKTKHKQLAPTSPHTHTQSKPNRDTFPKSGWQLAA